MTQPKCSRRPPAASQSTGSWIEIVVDPDTGQLIGKQHHQPAGWHPGAVESTSSTTFERALVDEVPADIRDTATHQECVFVSDNIVECTTEA